MNKNEFIDWISEAFWNKSSIDCKIDSIEKDADTIIIIDSNCIEHKLKILC